MYQFGGHIHRLYTIKNILRRELIMKRFLTFVVCAAMILSMAAIGVSAKVSYSTTAPTDAGTLVVKKGASLEEITESNGSVVNLASGGTSFCPKKDCWVRYEFTAEKAGTYTFAIEYIARTGTNRGVDYAIDSTTDRVFVDLEESNEKNFAIITEELTAGTHSFYFFCPTGFDDSSLKSCDVYGWSAYFTKEAAPETTADSGSSVSNAPQTADTAVIGAIALAVSATAAIIVAKKRH